jgi:hypothetical protein
MTVGRWLVAFGVGCLAIVVLTHIAEKLNLFPVMGWGLPDSPGHYLDLSVLCIARSNPGLVGRLIARAV